MPYQSEHIRVRVADTIDRVGDYPNYSAAFPISKFALDSAKNQLDDISGGSKTPRWLQFRRATDMLIGVVGAVRDAGEPWPSNAWSKMYEIMCEYVTDTWMHGRDRVALFCNAELPGSSLSAINHFMRLRHPHVDLDWHASSLVEHGSTALGDTYGFVEHNRDRWTMNAQNNGDMTVLANVMDLARRFGPDSQHGGVDIYTHDAGMETTDWNAQESVNSQLHFGCALAGLLLLRPGGVFVAKHYTFYETFTWNLVLILSSMFDAFYMCKPLTSRQTNSEIYLVGVGFRALRDDVMDALVGRLANFTDAPLLDRTAAFSPAISALSEFNSIVYGQQISALNAAAELYNAYDPQDLQRRLGPLRNSRTQEWLRRYPIAPIMPSLRIRGKDATRAPALTVARGRDWRR